MEIDDTRSATFEMEGQAELLIDTDLVQLFVPSSSDLCKSAWMARNGKAARVTGFAYPTRQLTQDQRLSRKWRVMKKEISIPDIIEIGSTMR